MKVDLTKKKWWVLGFALIAGLFPGSAPANSTSGRAADAIARVNDDFIPRQKLGKALIHAIGPEVIGDFIHREIIKTEARSHGVSVSETELSERIELQVEIELENLYEHNRTTREEFAVFLRDSGMEMEQLTSRLRDSIPEEELSIRLKVEKMLGDEVEIADSEIESLFRWRYGPRIVAAHIQVTEEETARQLHGHLQRNPDDWSAVLHQFSRDRRSIRYDGRMLPFPADSVLGKAFENREPDDIFIHQTERGWHVMRVINMFQKADVSLEDVKERLEKELIARRVENKMPVWLARRREKTIIKEPQAPDEEGILFYMNGRAVEEREFSRMLIEQFGIVYVERVIESELIARKAEQINKSVPAEALDSRLEFISEQLFISEAFDEGYGSVEMEARLLSEGISPQLYRDRIQRRYLHPEGVNTMLKAEKIAAGVMISEETGLEKIREIHSGPRLVVQRLVRNSREEAEQLREEAGEADGFSRWVLLESDDPLAWLGCGVIWDVTPEERYYEKAENLAPGQYSEIFKEAGKYVFFRLLQRSKTGESDVEQRGEEQMLQWYRRREARRAIPALIEKLKIESEIEIYH